METVAGAGVAATGRLAKDVSAVHGRLHSILKEPLVLSVTTFTGYFALVRRAQAETGVQSHLTSG